MPVKDGDLPLLPSFIAMQKNVQRLTGTRSAVQQFEAKAPMLGITERLGRYDP
jgi:hypothetical protein